MKKGSTAHAIDPINGAYSAFIIQPAIAICSQDPQRNLALASG
jgi:hypothetical protein